MPPKRKKRKVITYESWSKKRKAKRFTAAASSEKEISNSIQVQERRPNEKSSAPGAQPTKSSKTDTLESEKENVYDTDELFDEKVWAEPVILSEPVSVKTWQPISSSTISTFKEIMESNVEESLRGLRGNERKTAEKRLREIITKVSDKLKDDKVPSF